MRFHASLPAVRRLLGRAGVAALLAGAAIVPAVAQDSGPIIVTGTGLPDTPATPAYGTVTIDRETITSSASGRLEDVLGNVAGFQQFRRSDSRSSNPSAQGITLRALGGNASSRAQVLLDGVPMADPFFGYIPFSAIAPERLARARVTRGGGSGPFGAGALAGTVELESAGAETLGLFSGEALVDHRGETALSATVAPELSDGFAVVSGRWDRGQGFFTTPADQRVPPTARAAFDSWSASARLVQQVAPALELQLRGLAFDDHRMLRFAGADSSSQGQDLSVRLVGRGAWQVDALAYGQWRNFTNRVISATSYALTLDQRDTPSTGFGGKLEVRPPVGGGHTLRLGTDYRRSEGDLAEDRYLASGAANGSRFAGGVNSTLGLFVEDDWQLGPVVLTGGLRADRWSIRNGYQRNLAGSGAVLLDETYADREGWEVNWRAGATYDAGAGVQLRAAGYSGFRLPNLNELYRPFVVFPVTTSANPRLGNERLTGVEAGVDWQLAPAARLSFTAFDNRIRGAIANVTLTGTERQRQNLDAVRARGLELAGEVTQGRLALEGTLALTDAEVEADGAAAALDGYRPAQVPAWAGSATVSWNLAEGARIAATLRHVGRQFEGDQEDDPLPAATTVDLFAQVPLHGALTLVGRIENLLDEDIVTRNGGGSIDLGVPFTAWAGVRYGF
ncbi:TonB-dependent receptor domain-containing protein [Croceibacterium ferulae]|uniref:TonB-dependent receptor plug domain-containing protein n=1 Tax=Croceibacterium ferulae TaxID=1854641 RepID=UPI000EB4D0BC